MTNKYQTKDLDKMFHVYTKMLDDAADYLDWFSEVLDSYERAEDDPEDRDMYADAAHDVRQLIEALSHEVQRRIKY